MDWEDYRGLEVKQMNDIAGDASGIRLAAWWTEDIMTTSPQLFAAWRRAAYMLLDGTSRNKGAIYSVLPDALDIWIVFCRHEVERSGRC